MIVFLLLSINRGNTSDYIFLDNETPEVRRQTIQRFSTDPALVKPLYQMALDITELLEKHHIKYWAIFGTLMGAVRQVDEGGKFKGGLMPWDDDFDFGIQTADAPKINQSPFIDELHALGYAIADDDLVGWHVYQIQKVFLPTQNKEVQPFLDLFFMQQENDQWVLSQPKGRKFFPKCIFLNSQVETLVRYPFGGFEIWGPTQPELFLERQYGPTWAKEGHYHFSHHMDEQPKKYVWTLSAEDLQPAPYEGTLVKRVDMVMLHVGSNIEKKITLNFNMGTASALGISTPKDDSELTETIKKISETVQAEM